MWLKPVKTVLFDWMALKIFVFHHFFSLSFPAAGIRKRGDGNLFWLLLSQGSYTTALQQHKFPSNICYCCWCINNAMMHYK